MIDNKKKVAIIPARGGSKRIPKKNIKNFHNKPLISYSIKVAQESNLFDKIIVSTDSNEIAEIAKEYGAEVPFIRPDRLSDDFSGTEVVRDHALNYLSSLGEEYDFCCMIYATAPLLQKEFLIEGFNKLRDSTASNSFACTTMPFPIQRTFKFNKTGRCEMFNPEYYMSRSQDLEEAYQDAGQFYWTNLKRKSKKVMFSEDSIPIVIPRYYVQDIDTYEDWERAEYLYQMINNK